MYEMEENNMANLSIIYDVTRECPHCCAICANGSKLNADCSNELSLEQKLSLIRQIFELNNYGYSPRVDMSGGEIFVNKDDHMQVIKLASSLLGKDNVGISTSGYNMTAELAKELAANVGDVELTMDVIPGKKCLAMDGYREYRPEGYSVCAEAAIPFLKKEGVKVGVQTVVGRHNASESNAEELLKCLCDLGVDEWSILQFLPVGRGSAFVESYMSDSECEKYIKMHQKLMNECMYENKPVVDYSYLMAGSPKNDGVCRCVRKSIGIAYDGTVTACFWAIDGNGTVDENSKFYLGNVKKQKLIDILNGERAKYWSSCEHCCELGRNNNETNTKVVA